MGIRSTPNTNATSVTTCQSNKTIFTPSFPPWVLYFPCASHNTNQKYCMICWMPTIVKNTRTVMRPIGCIYRYWNWSFHDCIFQPFAFKNWSHRINLETSSVFLTFLGDCSVRVFNFSGNSFIFNVLKRSFCPSTVASSISIQIRAINKLLLR